MISSRAGLEGGKKITLSQIGDQFHLSRERIRQIERDVMAKLSDRLHQKHPEVIQLVVATVEQEGGVVSEETLVHLVLPKERRESGDVNAFRLFLRLMKDLVEIKESKTLRAGWVVRTIHRTVVEEAVSHAVSVIQEAGSVVDFEAIWGLSADYQQYGKNFGRHVISLSKEIIQTTDKKFGLSTWPTVNPRNVRDKIYYVLHQSGSPLHFTEIAKRIEGKQFDAKKIVQPTVHNELIADGRFVLVGRGIYALAHWGYKPGTVEQVIEEVLKKAKRPLTTDEIVEAVLKSRQVRKNTIIINLQIKPQFVKVGKKLYTLSEAATGRVPQEVRRTIAVAENKRAK